MQNRISQKELQESIRQLEARQKIEDRELKHQLEIAYESVKPVNLIKSTFKEVVNSDSLKGDVIYSSVGLATGMLTRTLFVGFSSSPVRKLLGTVLMFGITNLVSKRREVINVVGKKLLDLIARRRDAGKQRQLEAQRELPTE